MKIATLTGHSYAITASRPCTVSAVAGDGSLISLLSITVPGQYVLVAPSTMLDINEDHTLVTPMKGRPATRSAFKTALTVNGETVMLMLLHRFREQHYRSCKQWGAFGKGWINRLDAAASFAAGLLR